MAEMKKFPYKLDFGVWLNGRSMPIWVYDHVPNGMSRVTSLRQLWYGRPFLFASQLKPGTYMTSYMRDTVIEPVKYMLSHDIPIYVKESKNH